PLRGYAFIASSSPSRSSIAFHVTVFPPRSPSPPRTASKDCAIAVASGRTHRQLQQNQRFAGLHARAKDPAAIPKAQHPVAQAAGRGPGTPLLRAWLLANRSPVDTSASRKSTSFLDDLSRYVPIDRNII